MPLAPQGGRPSLLLLLFVAAAAAVPRGNTAIRSGEVWLDTDGHEIQAHSGRVFFDATGGRYYWYGMRALNSDNANHTVECYSSTNLLDWIHEGAVLTTSHYISRPVVMQHPTTGEYIMWMKSTPNVAVASAKAPTGVFTLLGAPFKLFGFDVGSLAAYVDPAHPSDAYLVYSEKPGAGNNNTRRIVVAPLQPSWTSPSRITARFDGHLEGCAVFRNASTYYIWTSHTSGWKGSPAVVHYASSMDSTTWTDLGYNPTHNKTSWESQSSDILPWPTPQAPRLFIYVADRFIPYIDEGQSSRPVWLPFCISARLDISVPWRDAWAPADASDVCQ